MLELEGVSMADEVSKKAEKKVKKTWW